MIQRKQTLFLLELIFLSIALLFIPVTTVVTTSAETLQLSLTPASGSAEISSSSGHMVAVGLNFIALILAFVTIFMYKKRELQVKLCYLLAFIWVVITLMIACCPFVVKTDAIASVSVNYFAGIIGVFAILAAFLAARFIKKDIELLKSADRIR